MFSFAFFHSKRVEQGQLYNCLLNVFPNYLHLLFTYLSWSFLYGQALTALPGPILGPHPHIICLLTQKLHLSSGFFSELCCSCALFCLAASWVWLVHKDWPHLPVVINSWAAFSCSSNSDAAPWCFTAKPGPFHSSKVVSYIQKLLAYTRMSLFWCSKKPLLGKKKKRVVFNHTHFNSSLKCTFLY